MDPIVVGDTVAFRAHKVDAVIFVVADILIYEDVLYLMHGSGILFMASECRRINSNAIKDSGADCCPR